MGVHGKPVELGKELSRWAREEQRRCRKQRVGELSLRLEELMSVDPGEDNLMELLEVKLTLNMEVDKEELY